MAAFEYQVLHTVYAWLSLKEGEVLMVEGAEDFDRLSEENAEAVQVKHSKANISLGQQKVIRSLNQFWEVISKDSRVVTCTYLSSSGAVPERDSPFGENRSCLSLWSSGSLSDEEVKVISTYLAEKAEVSDELKRFLSSESVEKRRDGFFDRIRWRFDSGDAETIERIILDRLTRFEGPYRIERASVLRKVLRALKDEVWRSLRKSADRLLDSWRLVEVWEREVSFHLSESELQALRSAGSFANRDERLVIESSATSTVPPLPSLCLKRNSLISTCLTGLRHHAILFLHGSSKMGKTTLAKCVAEASDRDCLWWSGAGKSSDEIGLELKALCIELETLRGPLLLILDNLDLSASSYPKLETSVLTIRELLTHAGAQLLINSEYPLCSQAEQGMALPEESQMTVPRLSPEEIEKLLHHFACPLGDSHVKSWATSIWARSKGHPLLSVIRICCLRDRGWPSFSAERNAKEEVISEIQDAHQLIEDLSEKQVEFLLRLSLFPGFFRRDHAKEVGDLAPGIDRPGSQLTRLVGPWVEPVTEKHYQLTPLLSDLAKADQTTKWCSKFRKKILQILLSTEPSTIIEAADAFQIAWEDSIEEALTGFAMQVMGQDERVHAQLGKRVLWFIAQGVTPEKLLFPENPTLSLVFRPIQFQFAMSAWPRFVPLIAKAWKAELDQFPDAHSQKDHLRIYLVKVLTFDGVIFGAKQLVDFLEQLRSVGLPSEIEDRTHYLMSDRGTIDMLTLMALQRGKEFQYLEELIIALDELDPKKRTAILKDSLRDAFDCNLMINKIWLHEADKEDPDWRGLIAAFQRCLEIVARWKLPILVGAFFRGSYLVLEEYLEDYEAIARLLETAEKDDGVPEEVVWECLSSFRSVMGEYEEIGQLTEKVLERLPETSLPFDTQRAMLLRRAGIAAGKLEHWSEAASWFQRIPENLINPEDHIVAAGSHAERAFCFWKEGDKEACFDAMFDALKASGTLGSRADESAVFVARKLIMHMVSWICGEAGVAPVQTLATPVLGAATSGEAPEDILELPPPDESYSWPLLSRFEESVLGTSKALKKATKSVEKSNNPGAKFLIVTQGIREMLTTGEVGELPHHLITLAEVKNEAMRGAPTGLQSPPRANSHEFLLEDAVPCLAAIVGLSRKDSLFELSSLLESWRCSLGNNLNGSWRNWFDSIETILSMQFEEALEAQKAERKWERNMLFLWNFITSSRASRKIRIQAQFLWLHEIGNLHFHDRVEETFCNVAEATWQNLIDSPGLLHSPRLFLPEVKRILSEEPASYRKLAQLLKAGAPLLGLEFDMNDISHFLPET